MAEIYKDTNLPIKARISWKGEVVDNENPVVVVIYDITEDPKVVPPVNPNVPVGIYTAEKEESDPGTYLLYMPLHLTTRLKKLKLHWQFTIDGGDTEFLVTYCDIVAPYVNMSEVVEDLGLGAEYSDPNFKNFHDLRMAEKYARKMVEYYTGQKFFLFDDTFTIMGNDSDTLPLPRKLHSLHSLHQNDQLWVDNLNQINYLGYALEPTTSGFGIKINQSALLDNDVYIANGMVPPSIHDVSPNIFKRGKQYKVYGRFGWENVPDEIEQATIEIMRSYFSKDRVWKDRYVNKISTTDWDFQYTSDAFTGTGSAYADKLLLDYVVTQMVVV
jgi:hypothetical protein